ncbi:MarR family winged helix-turn-helix transcriptional regulator [Azonexus sp. IMCC34839]|uniref:MarR family winged helix-turn-helix transcriptional regulator n=1 Tax=Azonexus sp. IMCC34839 TaxID=3133695 RepID=UPI00399A7965
MPDDITPLALDVLQQFRMIFGSMRQYFRLVEERCGIPGSQVWVLQEAQRQPGLGINELGALMGIHQSTASLLVDKLAKRKLLAKKRGTTDQRRVGLFLTPQGEQTLALLPGPAEGILPAALNQLPDVVLHTLNINLSELIRHLPGKDESFAGEPLADLLEKQAAN